MRKCLFIGLCVLLGSFSAQAGVWDSVFVADSKSQAIIAQKIFQRISANGDSTSVMKALDNLEEQAIQHGALEVEIVVPSFKGIYLMDLVNKVYPDLAVSYFRESLQKARQNNFPDMEVSLMNILGYTLFRSNTKEEGLWYMLRALKLAEERDILGFQQLIMLAIVFEKLGNYNRVITYAEAALRYNKNREPMRDVEVYNVLGLAYKEKGLYVEALDYFKKARELALKYNTSPAIATVEVNIASLYLKMKQYYPAKIALRNSENHAKLSNCWDCLSFILVNRIQAEIGLGELVEARESQRRLTELIQQVEVELQVLTEYYEQTAHLCRLEGRHSEAYRYYDSLFVAKDSLNREKDASMSANLEAQLVSADMALKEEENHRQRVIRNAGWVISGMTILLLGGLLYGLRMRQKRKQTTFQLEQQKKENQINQYRNRLKYFISGIREKNILIEQLRSQVDQHNFGEVTYGQTAVSTELMEQLYNAIILTEEDWTEFKRLYEKVHPGFIGKILQEFPDLTVSELRFLILYKLNLSKSEIASMLGILPDSVRQLRWRLMKKLNMSTHKDIASLSLWREEPLEDTV